MVIAGPLYGLATNVPIHLGQMELEHGIMAQNK